MRIEHPNALRFILQEDIYLLEKDKGNLTAGEFDIKYTEPSLAPELKTEEINFNYLGGNKKNFLILTNYTGHEFIADEHLQALESVLTRIGYSRDDVAILNTVKDNTDYKALSDYFNPEKLLILGEPAIPAGMKKPKFNERENDNGLTTLYTFSFDEMMTNTNNKKAFWEQIKQF